MISRCQSTICNLQSAIFNRLTSSDRPVLHGAGILSNGADFISIDKYGLDGGQQQNAPQDPANLTLSNK